MTQQHFGFLISAFARAPKPARAFTLIELMVTVALLSLILYMLATVYTAAHIAFTDTRRAVQVAQTGRAVLDSIRNDLMGATLIKTSEGKKFFLGADPEPAAPTGLEADPKWNQPPGGWDTLSFLTETFQPSRSVASGTPGSSVPPLPQLIKIKYYRTSDGIMKRANWDGEYAEFNPDSADEPEAVGLNLPGIITITRLDFRYLGTEENAGAPGFAPDGNWDISLDRLPVAVEATLTVDWRDSRARARSTVFTELIYLPNSEFQ